MKLLLISGERSPFLIQEEHLKKIRAKDKEFEIFVVSASQQKEIERHLSEADVVAGWVNSVPSWSHAKNLKWVHAFFAGVDKVLTPELVHSPALVSSSSGIHATPIGEHIVAFALAFTRKLYPTFLNQQRKRWERRNDLGELKGKAILIVGLGRIGREAARLLQCFGARIIALDKEKKEKPEFVQELRSIENLGTALPEADFVILCVPYTQETHYLFGREQFQKMKSSAVIINISRGGVINEKELIEALQKKTIAGAGLDVTETEPLPPDSPLWTMENVIITPHHSGISEKYMDRAVDLFCTNLKAFLGGQELPNFVDKTRGY